MKSLELNFSLALMTFFNGYCMGLLQNAVIKVLVVIRTYRKQVKLNFRKMCVFQPQDWSKGRSACSVFSYLAFLSLVEATGK